MLGCCSITLLHLLASGPPLCGCAEKYVDWLVTCRPRGVTNIMRFLPDGPIKEAGLRTLALTPGLERRDGWNSGVGASGDLRDDLSAQAEVATPFHNKGLRMGGRVDEDGVRDASFPPMLTKAELEESYHNMSVESEEGEEEDGGESGGEGVSSADITNTTTPSSSNSSGESARSGKPGASGEGAEDDDLQSEVTEILLDMDSSRSSGKARSGAGASNKEAGSDGGRSSKTYR